LEIDLQKKKFCTISFQTRERKNQKKQNLKVQLETYSRTMKPTSMLIASVALLSASLSMGNADASTDTIKNLRAERSLEGGCPNKDAKDQCVFYKLEGLKEFTIKIRDMEGTPGIGPGNDEHQTAVFDTSGTGAYFYTRMTRTGDVYHAEEFNRLTGSTAVCADGQCHGDPEHLNFYYYGDMTFTFQEEKLGKHHHTLKNMVWAQGHYYPNVNNWWIGSSQSCKLDSRTSNYKLTCTSEEGLTFHFEGRDSYHWKVTVQE
jgi:hypothetical protein